MSTPTTGQIPAGWYQDPTTPGQNRWWNGAEWTSDIQAVPQQQPPAPTPGTWMPSPSPAPVSAPPVYQQATPASQTAPAGGWQRTDAYRIGNEGADLASGKNTPATVGLTFGIISLAAVPIACILGLVFSIKGLRRSKRYALSGHDSIGRKKSIWGIVLSSIGTVIAVLILISLVNNSSGVQAGIDKARSDHAAADTGGTYLGTDLAADVTRALTANGATVTDVTCADTAKVAAGVITDCKATVNGTPTGIRVTWDDAKGHFTTMEQAL
jgi:Protein of unknown function (DUF2510)/Domain of unknown function (DUF4333)